MDEIVVGRRFNGPPASGNGGWTSGAVAQALLAERALAEPITVGLRTPPPLERPLRLEPAGDTWELRDGETVVAVARTDDSVSWTEPVAVAVEAARSAEGSYAGHRAHPFPTCFSCGPVRAPGDGLRIFPGRIEEDLVASTWSPQPSVTGPDGTVGLPVTWAALDCVGGWSSDLEHRPMVLAQMTARVVSPPQAGATYVLTGRQLRTEGRKTWTASHLMADDGTLLGQAEQLWIAVDWAVVQQLQRS